MLSGRFPFVFPQLLLLEGSNMFSCPCIQEGVWLLGALVSGIGVRLVPAVQLESSVVWSISCELQIFRLVVKAISRPLLS